MKTLTRGLARIGPPRLSGQNPRDFKRGLETMGDMAQFCSQVAFLHSNGLRFSVFLYSYGTFSQVLAVST